MLDLREIDLTAASELAGALSIACWICVFIPQVFVNCKNGSTEGLSFAFLVLWLAGDIFNIVGSVLQDVLLTMLIIAIYYTVADVVVVFQFFYFNSFNLQAILGRSPPPAAIKSGSTPSWGTTASSSTYAPGTGPKAATAPPRVRRTAALWNWLNRRTAQLPTIPESPLVTAILDTLIVVFVCTAGFLGWLLAGKPGDPDVIDPAEFRASLQFDVAGQVLGWLCCVMYLGSRVPQLVMNYRRKSTDGLSALMFVFALLGNSTYVASIFLYKTPCGAHQSAELRDICGGPDGGGASAVYARYVLINLSWILGSTVTIFMDLGILGQHLWYTRKAKHESLLAVLSV